MTELYSDHFAAKASRQSGSGRYYVALYLLPPTLEDIAGARPTFLRKWKARDPVDLMKRMMDTPIAAPYLPESFPRVFASEAMELLSRSIRREWPSAFIQVR